MASNTKKQAALALRRVETQKRNRRAKEKTRMAELSTGAGVVLGGAGSALVNTRLPAETAGLPTNGLIGIGLVVGSQFLKGSARHLIGGSGFGMVAVAVSEFTTDALEAGNEGDEI